MEEKERYESKYNEKLMKHYAFDNENKEELGYKGVVRVLNQQSKRIKELNTKLVEEMELSAERRQIIEDLTIENKQLEEQLNYYKGTKLGDFADEIRQLKQSQKQLAIEELEKLKDFFLEPYKDEEMDTDYIITKDAGEIADYILDQIKQLKEGK